MFAGKRVWREAATLILTSRVPTLNHFDYQVLMLQRSSKSKFMPNAFVFPGGVIAKEDFSRDWLELFTDLGCSKDDLSSLALDGVDRPLLMQGRSEDVDNAVARDIAFRLSAIRETFEECGVLLVRPSGPPSCSQPSVSQTLTFPSPAQQSDWRSLVHNDPSNLVKLCREFSVLPDIWSLYEWSDWLTPTDLYEQKGRRFDTLFYTASVESVPSTVLDQQEVSNIRWSDPATLLQQYHDRQFWLAPPQVYELSRLSNFKQQEDLVKFSHSRHSKGLITWLPVREKCSDGVVSLLPGDSRYPSNPDYVGDPDTKQVKREYTGTLQESSNNCDQHNRLEFPSSSTCRTLVTIIADHGHVNPVCV